jgi:carbonic anhydrase
MAVLDPAETVVEDVQKLHSAPELQPTIGNVKIGGYAYDLKTGEITTVVEPSYGSPNPHRPDVKKAGS